jgi:spore germination protein YaaH
MGQLDMKVQKHYSKKLIIAGLLLSLFLTGSSITYFLLYPFASEEKADYFKSDFPIIYNGKQSGNAFLVNNDMYVSLNFLRLLDDSITYDSKSNSVIFTNAEKVVQMPTDSLTYFINEKPVKLNIAPLQLKDKNLYVALETFISLYPYQYKILEGTKAVLIQGDGDVLQEAKVTNQKTHVEKLRLRTGPDLDFPYTAQISGGEKLFIEDKKGDYYFVRKENGIAGYVHKELIIPGKMNEIAISKSVPPKKMPDLTGPIHLTWEAVYTKNPDTSKIPAMPGVNVVSPTWFHLESGNGSIKSLASTEYSNWAKSKGLHVWGLFTNSFDPALTHEAFKDFETRQKIIRQLLHYSQMYGLQGINLDIENVNPEDGPLVTQFVREASPFFREAGLVLSLDITFLSNSGNWSQFYEREKLVELVDYLAVMAYDEHWASSQVSGSVSSLPWVERNLETLLKIVPKEKLILGVPLYTRLWSEKETEDGTIIVSSKSLSMAGAKQWLTDHKVTVSYDSASGQNYAEHYNEEEKTKYKIWLEDELSLKKRVQLAEKHDLAGIATWSRFFADSSAWTALKLGEGQSVTKK